MKVFGVFFTMIVLFIIATTGYGLILAFKASLILGVIVLFVEPAPLILGLIGLFGHPEVAQKIVQWLGM